MYINPSPKSPLFSPCCFFNIMSWENRNLCERVGSLGFEVVIERPCWHAVSVGSTPSFGFVQLYVLAKFGETLYEDDSYALKLYFYSQLIAQIFCAQVAVYKIAVTCVSLFFVLFHRCIVKIYKQFSERMVSSLV